MALEQSLGTRERCQTRLGQSPAPQGWTPALTMTAPSSHGPSACTHFQFFIPNPQSRVGTSRRFQLGMPFQAWFGGRCWVLHPLPLSGKQQLEDKEGSTAPGSSQSSSCARILLLEEPFDAPPKGGDPWDPSSPASGLKVTPLQRQLPAGDIPGSTAGTFPAPRGDRGRGPPALLPLPTVVPGRGGSVTLGHRRGSSGVTPG